MTCELAGSYDLLVPLMLAEGIAFVALRRRSLYHAQLGTKRDSPAHAHEMIADVLETKTVADVVVRDRVFVSFAPATPLREVIERIAQNDWQDAFPVLSHEGAMIGLVDTATLRLLGADHEVEAMAVAADVMRPPLSVRPEDDLHDAVETMVKSGFRELPVVDERGQIIGFLDEADVTRVYLEITDAVAPPPSSHS
jgi:CIC family chloride channel protein